MFFCFLTGPFRKITTVQTSSVFSEDMSNNVRVSGTVNLSVMKCELRHGLQNGIRGRAHL